MSFTAKETGQSITSYNWLSTRSAYYSAASSITLHFSAALLIRASNNRPLHVTWSYVCSFSVSWNVPLHVARVAHLQFRLCDVTVIFRQKTHLSLNRLHAWLSHGQSYSTSLCDDDGGAAPSSERPPFVTDPNMHCWQYSTSDDIDLRRARSDIL